MFHKFKKGLKIVKKFFFILGGIFLIYFIFCLPDELFEQDSSKLLLDRNGNLLEARIAKDGQWRFPLIDSVPYKFETCIVRFEDKNFRRHFGVNPIAVSRAIYLNLKHKKVMSGASTISMQTIRLLRKNKSRTFTEKIIEMIWAMRLETKLSKDEILNLYATYAPFGGNVVGVETASWRYFNRPPSQLSWSEAAMLAVLPNAPGLIHLNKNRDALLKKRNKLLATLAEEKLISEEAYLMASNEPLPQPLHRLPHHCFHLVDRLHSESNRIESTIDIAFQKQFNEVTAHYNQKMKRKNVHNLSAVLIDVKKGEVLAYVGNSYKNNDEHSGKVDMMNSVRSSGSILKPILYAASLSEGLIAPQQLLPDYPMNFSGYQPSNYNPDYDGMVPANEALFRSLNIPAAWLVQQYGVAKFKNDLNQLGLTSVNRPASNYGLSLILGGAEVNLLQLTGLYASFANQLQSEPKKEYTIWSDINHTQALSSHHLKFDAGSIYATLSALTNTYRPETEANWKTFSSSRKVAWKTGTSYGNRDAWAVGVTPEYAIGVWVGNSDGEGISGLTGLNNAAPLLFQLYDLLPQTKWFYQPYGMTAVKICAQSGMKTNPSCPASYKRIVPNSISKTVSCSYHKSVMLDEQKKERVYRQCYAGTPVQETYFVLPPIAANYYQKKNPDYNYLPKMRSECLRSSAQINVLYPQNKSRISLPKGELVARQINAKILHENPNSQLYWELNGVYLGATNLLHEKTLSPKIGVNKLSLIDEEGNVIQSQFTVI